MDANTVVPDQLQTQVMLSTEIFNKQNQDPGAYLTQITGHKHGFAAIS